MHMKVLRGLARMSTATASRPTRALVAHIYVSEGRDSQLVSRIAAAGTAAGATIVNQFVDAAYHRSGISLASADDRCLEAGIDAVCQDALAAIDFSVHCASHPRIGAVDHVAVSPLGTASLDEAAALARSAGERLGHGSPPVPVFLYGAARADARSLAELRRSLGYFGGAARSEWVGMSAELAEAVRVVGPDLGPAQADPKVGAAVVGAVPWVANYNVLVRSASLAPEELLARCRRISRAVSTRGGGLPGVEAMALLHESGVEVACNLLDESGSGASAAEVQELVTDLCGKDGLEDAGGYYTNKRPEDVLALVVEALQSG